MRRLPLVAALMLLAACQRDAPPPAPAAIETPAPAAPAPPAETASPTVASEDWTLPGTLGPLTTRQALEARFGKANVREVTFDGAEGIGTYPALVVFPDDPSRRLELVLDAEDKDAPIQELRVRAPGSRWRDASGLRMGMTLPELAALNGAPISFYGLEWDYGGTVQDWHGGRLANAAGAALFRRVTLGARAGTSPDAVPIGDSVFRSDDARLAGVGDALEVAEFGISWPREGED
ncbi:MAG: hypothetical protein J0M21_05985 [Xanthomonadales bacterium]|nr:hypothetical protein [Xanthomonadales bacterium]